MATQYSLTCINNSKLIGSFAVFDPPMKGAAQSSAWPLAWFSPPTNPGDQVTCQWKLNESGIWSSGPGVPEAGMFAVRGRRGATDDAGPSCWVAFGDLTPSQVMDADDLDAVEVSYPAPLTQRTVTLLPDGTFTVA